MAEEKDEWLTAQGVARAREAVEQLFKDFIPKSKKFHALGPMNQIYLLLDAVERKIKETVKS